MADAIPVYLDFDDILCETARAFTGLLHREFGKSVAFEDIHTFNLGESFGLAEKIVREHPDARIVMVSSVGYQENIVAALQRGARHFVQKPVKPEVLYEVIKYVMKDDGAAARSAGAGA